MPLLDRGFSILRKIRRRLRDAAFGTPVPTTEPYQFSPDAREVSSPTPEPPYPFQNILDNNAYYTLIDQCARGLGRHLTPEGYACNLVENERHVYVRDDETGKTFLIDYAPAFRPFATYRCTHGLGYTVIEQTRAGLHAAWRIFVPPGDDPVEIWDVRLRDLAGRPRRLSLFTHIVMTGEGTDLYFGDMCRIVRFEPELESLFLRMDTVRHTEINFPRHNAFMTARPAPAGWDANPGSFLGPHRTLANPRAVEQGRCENSAMPMWPPIAALHVRLELPAAGDAGARFLIGACDHEDSIRAMREKYLGENQFQISNFKFQISDSQSAIEDSAIRNPQSAIENAGGTPALQSATQFSALRAPHSALEQSAIRNPQSAILIFPPCPHFAALCAAQERLTANLRLQTPEPRIDRMLNDWVKKQIHHGALWGRWGFKGYRDALQQAIGVAALDPAQARRNILDCCRHQYANGFALRGWRPVDTKRYADCAQWLIHATTEYLKETGDFALLEECVPYFDRDSGTVAEHLERAMKRLHLDRGPHRLCLAHGGDWNDSLTGVCRYGRGESVWLSMAFCRCALLLQELYLQIGDTVQAARMAGWHAEMKTAINTHAWDGDWYLCALDDDGNPIGSARNEEGRLFLILQAWAVWGRVADGGRWERAWAAVRRHLDTGWGFRLVWPSYTHYQPGVGRLSTIRPGVTENGSVYTHGNAFMLHALLELGLPDEALALWQAIAPGNPARPLCQPNVFFSGYYGPDSEILPGLADHPWMTGSAAWMLQATVELLLGARRTYRGLALRPCLPGGWPGASLTRTFRGTTYHITIDNPGAVPAAAVARITIDGREYSPRKPLPLTGGEHRVQVTLSGQPHSMNCGLRIADCGFDISESSFNPQSAIRNPQFPGSAHR